MRMSDRARRVRLQARRCNTMSKSSVQKIVPHLWYTKEAEEAARFYAFFD